MNQPRAFKFSILMVGLAFTVTLFFGMYVGYEWCSIHNNVSGMREQLSQMSEISVQVNSNARKSAIKVEEQINDIEKGFEQMRAALNELKRNAGKAAEVGMDKAEELGKNVEAATKEAKDAVSGSGSESQQ